MENNQGTNENAQIEVQLQRKKQQSKKIILLVFLILTLIAGVAFCINLSYGAQSKDRIIDNGPITIPIAMAADDNYTYPTVVAMTSIMENAKATTKCEFYLMHPAEFKQSSKDKILTVQDKYENCTINLINMEDRFKRANTKGHITTPAYYRLSLSSLLPDLDRILWLDGDTIIKDDLREMYKLDMTGLYYRGFLDNNVDGAEPFGVDNDHYICDGVMVINLDLLRKDNVEAKFMKFIEENNKRLVQHDQTVVNVVCCDYIGVLPPVYGMVNTTNINWYHSVLKPRLRYDLQELVEAYKNPIVLHYTTKPWKDKSCAYFDLWWEYAKMTPFYQEITDTYKDSLQ